MDGAAWAVWQGNIGWDVVSFVRERGATTVDLALAPFVDEAIARGATEPDDWMTSVQLGSEPWSGGAGLAARGFSFQPDGGGSAPSTAEAPTPAEEPTAPAGAALLVHGPSGLCLDARGGGAPGDPQVALWDCDPSQGWTPSRGTLVNDWTGACLGTVAGARAAGTAVQLQVCDGHPGQRWQPVPTGALRNTASGLCLAPRGGGTSDGTPLVLARCAGAPAWS